MPQTNNNENTVNWENLVPDMYFTSKGELKDYIFDLSGIDPTDPTFSDMMIEKRKNLRKKYHLPERKDYILKGDNIGYLEALKKLADENNIRYSPKKEYKGNVPQELFTGIYSTDDKTMFIDIPTDPNDPDIIKKILTFEHELIHALQDQKNEIKNLHQREFEAYLVSNANTDLIRNNPYLVFTGVKASMSASDAHSKS